MRRVLPILLLVPLALACERGGPPPYGFATQPEQRFVLEAEDRTTVDGQLAKIERYAEFRVVATPVDGRSDIELALYVERYYESVEREEGDTEVGISSEGILVRGGEQGELSLGPADRTPTADSVTALLDRPVASAIVSPAGEVQGPPWHSYDPLLAEIATLEWFVFVLPQVEEASTAAWSGSRQVPRLGRYRLGIQLPMRYQRVEGAPDGRERIQAEGFARREGLTLADDLSGNLELDYRSQVELSDQTRLANVTSELVLDFEAQDGGQVRSEHRLRIRALGADAGVNSESAPPDQTGS